MSCCVVKKEKSSEIEKSINFLKNYFDEVFVEKHKKFNRLVIRDKANKPNIDHIVWFDLKINLGKTSRMWETKPDSKNIVSVCDIIITWIDDIVDYRRNIQPSLFEELDISDVDEDFETKNKKILLKKYNVVDLLKDFSYYIYTGIDYRQQLPSIEEARELLKNKVANEMAEHFDNGELLSDTEIKYILNSIRFMVVPYTKLKAVSYDLSFTYWENERKKTFRYYIEREEVNPNCGVDDWDKQIYPSYKGLVDKELISWVRKTRNLQYKDEISDEEALKEGIKSYFSSLLWYAKYDWQNDIDSCKNWKEFKQRFLNVLIKNGVCHTHTGCYYRHVDDYSVGITITAHQKGKLVIEHDLETRKSLKRDFENRTINSYNQVVVYELTENEVFQKAFELFKRDKQPSLFDLMAS